MRGAHAIPPRPSERFVTSYLVFCRCRGSLGARNLGGGLSDSGLLLVKRPARGRDVGAGRGDLGLRLFDVGAVVAGIEHGEQLAAADRLVVSDEHTLDIAANLRRDRHEVRAHIGVVGRLQVLAARAVVHVPDDRRDDARNERGDEDVADDRIAREKRGLLTPSFSSTPSFDLASGWECAFRSSCGASPPRSSACSSATQQRYRM